MTNELNKKLSEQLARFIPQEAIPLIITWMQKHRVHLKVSKPRKSKRGDYRAPHRDNGHRISINGNLNPYDFLITLIHEFAHLFTYNLHKHTVAPHGREWKYQYQLAMQPFLDKHIFPQDVEQAIVLYMKNPAASTCNDPNLVESLKKYDPETQKDPRLVTVKSLNKNDYFSIPEDHRIFQKGSLRRTRYLCKEIRSDKEYTIPATLEVLKLDELPKPKEKEELVSIKHLQQGAWFSIPNDPRIFELESLRRTRFSCKEVISGKQYTIPATLEVFLREKI